MFGYLQPFKDELKIKDFRLYKSVYCGLCRSLAKEYGLLSSLTLSYDCTVLAMLYMSLNDEEYCVKKGRCTVNPLKKCDLCSSEGKAFSFAGAVSVIMSYHKLKDTMQDGGLLKKTAACFLRVLFHRNYRRAVKAYPEIDKLTAQMMESQNTAENEDAGVDRSADATAVLIKQLCTMIYTAPEDKHKLEVFGYYVGRWIYLMDAADDLPKDIKHKNFNPFIKGFDGDMENTMSYCEEVLNMTAAQIVLSYELLDIHSFKPVLDNIVYEGLLYQHKKCSEKNIKKDKKRG